MSVPLLDGLVQDVRYAVRALRRSPGFTLTAIATLAVGIGANAAVFTVVNAALFKAFPFVDRNDRVLYIERPGVGFSYTDFEEWRAQARSFEGMAAATAWLANLNDRNGVAERCAVTVISAQGFALIGQEPILGRNFASFDEVPGATPVAILSYQLWERRYAKDPAIIGRTVRLEVSGVSALRHDSATVIGVMAPGFSFPFEQDLWVPLVAALDREAREARNITFFFGRVADTVTLTSARAEMESIGRQLSRTQPAAKQGSIAVQSFDEHFVGARAATLFASMLGAVCFVLLIACANITNLMLARTIGRSREISVRIALGAGKGRIVRQLLVESLMISTAGGVFGWGVARLGVRVYELAGFAPFNYQHYIDLTMDYRVLGYLVAISTGTGLLFGLASAQRLWTLGLNATLKDGGRGATVGRRQVHLSALLVAGETALAVVLLAGAGVMVRSFVNVYTADVGVDTTNILMSDLGLPAGRYPSADARIAFYDRLEERLEAIPGVESIAVADRYPTQGASRLPYELAGAPPGDEQHRQTVSALIVSPDYFRTMGATVLSGREFTDADGLSGDPVVLVNERFASQQWPGDNPLGQRLRVFDGPTANAWRTVVGVVSNIVQSDLTRQAFDPSIYLPYRQEPTAFMYVFVRTHIPGGSLMAAVRRDIQALDPDMPASPLTLAARLDRNARDRGLSGAVLVVFAGIGLLLASLGLYAIVTHAVSRRTQEIGVRMAVGATSADVVALVLRQGALPVGIGLAVGLAGSLAITPVLGSMLVQVSPADPIAFAAALLVMSMTAMVGCLIPARRATRVDPVIALRHD